MRQSIKRKTRAIELSEKCCKSRKQNVTLTGEANPENSTADSAITLLIVFLLAEDAVPEEDR